ncbi:hypothetical protein IFM89_007141 [Coptis chinensis]|uniref:U-box domain-containing protein n=1 Tax=Coptis chinensis TaxID=261450 RepID=A0A835HDE0_9MAGN|nr:hypothetical protein IFM89_007141 [Coptis chinensis]
MSRSVAYFFLASAVLFLFVCNVATAARLSNIGPKVDIIRRNLLNNGLGRTPQMGISITFLLQQNLSISFVIKEAMRAEVENSTPSSESMVKIADSLRLTTNQGLLMEAVALEKLSCKLSKMKMMERPIIVASGQTYERTYIRKWLDLGLTVCPKTRQTLSHTNLIPNYTVKALIANWCETNNVNIPDPVKSMNLNQTMNTV